MTAYALPFLWCVLQAAVLSTLGLILARLFARKAPAAGATIAVAAAAMISLVTLLIPAPVPTLELWQASRSAEPLELGSTAVPSEHESGESTAPMDGNSIDVRKLAASMLTLMQTGGTSEQNSNPTAGLCVVGVFAFGAAIGGLRFLWALYYVTRLRRDASPIVDARALQIFAEVKERLGVARSIELSDSPQVGSPAAIGWRRPLVLLPVECTDWTEEQLRAALAHELAHVVRGDFLWRCVAGVTQAIHYFHPLVHVLTRRLTLMQELATDRLAASVAGGSAAYLRALSELAIRLDDHSRLRAEPIVLPALSSNLMRRITMLRSKEGSDAARSCSFASAVAVGLIALVGVGTMALRGDAEDIKPAPTADAPNAKLFTRSPLSPAVLSAEQGTGMFVVRPSELARHPAFGAIFPMLNKMLSDEASQIEGFVYINGRTPFRLEAIEYIAGTPQLTQRPKTADEKGLFMVGCSELVMRFHEPIDWLGWFEDVMPSCQPRTLDGLTYVSVSIPLLGPQPLVVASRDERTIVMALGLDHLRKMAASKQAPREGKVVDAWKSIDGGAAAFVGKAAFEGGLPPEQPGGEEFMSILTNIEQIAAGFDMDAESGQSQLKVTLTARSLTAGGRVQAAIQALLPLAKLAMQAKLDNPVRYQEDENAERKRVLTAGTEDSDLQVGRYILTLVENCETELNPQEDGGVEISITATAPFPTSVFSHYEYVAVKEAEGGPASKK